MVPLATDLPVKPKHYTANPNPSDLKKLVAAMPNAKQTIHGSYNVTTKVLARSKQSTFIVTDQPEHHTDATISCAKGAEMASLQDAYIRDQKMLVIDGFIGAEPSSRCAVRLILEETHANIAAMQQQLYFTPTAEEFANFTPQMHVIYTPNLQAPGFPNDRLIAVDLETYTTRIFNSDYFGESKKAGLRMWNKLIYDQNGLALHAGCKTIDVDGQTKSCLIIGLSGTGKTTTTFSQQQGSRPIQDDFVGWLPGNKILGTEDGCFAKTFGLNVKSEPMIHQAVTDSSAYLENVHINDDGTPDFFNDSYTQNGRATFPFELISNAGDVRQIPNLDFILILNRNNNIIPAVCRLTQAQAAAYFMLGETQGTSAGGVEEAGKALRVPGTNPFFPLRHAMQGNRFLELNSNSDADVYLLNTGWIGGPDGSEYSRKVKIRHSSAIVQAIADNSIEWTNDPTFGYQIAVSVPGLNDTDSQALLVPKNHYATDNRQAEYEHVVERLQQERQKHLQSFIDLEPQITQAV